MAYNSINVSVQRFVMQVNQSGEEQVLKFPWCHNTLSRVQTFTAYTVINLLAQFVCHLRFILKMFEMHIEMKPRLFKVLVAYYDCYTGISGFHESLLSFKSFRVPDQSSFGGS